MAEKTDKSKRIFWLDVLRVVSIVAVVTIHAATQNWERITAGTGENVVLSVFDALGRFAVPIFVMISGTLMLRRELSFKKCLKKVGRLLIVWVFWCVFYSLLALAMGKGTESALSELAFGHFHMWFLPMIAVLYLMTPILKWITKDQRRCVVAILVLLVVSVGLQFRWTAYPMYYLMGYMLGSGKWAFGKRRKMALALCMGMFLISVVATAMLNVKASVAEGTAVRPMDGDWSIFVIMQAMTIFVGAKILAGNGTKIGVKKQEIYTRLAGDVLGVYMVHIAVLGMLNRIGVSDVMFGGVIGVFAGTILTIILVVAISVVIVELMRRIPGLKRVV